MTIVVNNLCRDTLNFFKNQFLLIITLAMFISIINVFLNQILISSKDILLNSNINLNSSDIINFQKIFQQLSIEQQWFIIKVSVISTFINLVSNVLLSSIMLSLIYLLNNRQKINFAKIISLSSPFMPRLMLIIFLLMFLIQIGLMILVIPGIILIILSSLSPIIAVSKNVNAIKSIKLSMNLVFNNIQLVAPAVLCWLLFKLLLLIITIQTAYLHSLLCLIILNFFSNIISIILLVYLYRLYMFIK